MENEDRYIKNGDEKCDTLVSVIVITFNSHKFVIETLESVKAQSYKWVELIISDDFSQDETIELCENWLSDNAERFVRTELVESEVNSGIPANLNRGIAHTHGKWIKPIAGDDVLLPTCLEDNLVYVNSDSNIEICFSQSADYINTFNEVNLLKREKPVSGIFTHNYSSEEQFKILTFGCCMEAPTVFFQKELIFRIGMFDERIPRCEDYPMWLHMARNGVKLFFLNKVTVKYRIHEQSLSNKSMQGLLFNPFYSVERTIFDVHIRPYIDDLQCFFLLLIFKLKDVFCTLHLNRDGYLNKILFAILSFPARLYISYKLHLLKGESNRSVFVIYFLKMISLNKYRKMN